MADVPDRYQVIKRSSATPATLLTCPAPHPRRMFFEGSTQAGAREVAAVATRMLQRARSYSVLCLVPALVLEAH